MSSDVPADNEVQYEGEQVGLVTHYYDKISVAVVHAEKTMNEGDEIKIYDKAGNVVIEQQVESMEIDGKKQKSVDAGEDFGLKVEGEVKEGFTVYRQ